MPAVPAGDSAAGSLRPPSPPSAGPPGIAPAATLPTLPTTAPNGRSFLLPGGNTWAPSTTAAPPTPWLGNPFEPNFIDLVNRARAEQAQRDLVYQMFPPASETPVHSVDLPDSADFTVHDPAGDYPGGGWMLGEKTSGEDYYARRAAPRTLRGYEVNHIEQHLKNGKDDLKCELRFDDEDAKLEGNHFAYRDNGKSYIALDRKRENIPAGLMYEEVQHAIDAKNHLRQNSWNFMTDEEKNCTKDGKKQLPRRSVLIGIMKRGFCIEPLIIARIGECMPKCLMRSP